MKNIFEVNKDKIYLIIIFTSVNLYRYFFNIFIIESSRNNIF